LHRRAVALGDAYIAAHRLEAARAHAIPQPLSPFNWMVVVEQPQGYHLAYVSLLRKQITPQPAPDASWFENLNASYRPVKQAEWQPVPRYGAVDADRELAEAAWNSDALTRYRHFALFPAVYRLDRAPGRTCVWFNDLRFAVVGRTMPFRYGSCRDGVNGPWKVHRLTSDDDGSELFEAIPD
jgi:inner membrane protein